MQGNIGDCVIKQSCQREVDLTALQNAFHRDTYKGDYQQHYLLTAIKVLQTLI